MAGNASLSPCEMAQAKLSATVRILALTLLLLLPLAGCRGHDAEPRILLLVSVDTLRADRLGAYGSLLGITPHLDRLAEQSLVFDWTYAPTSFTLPSVSSLLTGRYPEEIGIRGNRSVLAPGIPTLAAALKPHGWRSAAVVSNLVLHAKAGLGADFERYDDALPGAESTRGWPERTAADTTDAAIAALDALGSERGQRLFLWVHYQDPHGPYTPPEGLRERFLAAERALPEGRRELPDATGRGGRGRIPTYQVIDDQREVAFYRAGYDAEVHYLDGQIGRLLAEIGRRGLDEASVVIFTADHGESLGEADYWFAHGDHLRDPLVRVPLLVRAPGLEPGRRSDVASLVDVFPTLLGLLTEAVADSSAPGRDLLAADASTRDSRPYFATLGSGGPVRFGMVADEHKLILSRQGNGWTSELFRLGDEDRNLVDTDPERAEDLRRQLHGLRRQLRRGPQEARQDLSDTHRRHLRALGYIGDADPHEQE
jgi:arylsulfatase A-like enzyme